MKTLVLAACFAAACAHGKPAAPSNVTQREIAQAETAERARQHDVARAHYEAAVASANDPASIAYARREFAETLMSWAEYPAAIAQLEVVVSVQPKAAASWHDLGILYHHAGDVPRAIAAFETAKQLVPADPRPRISLAALRWKAGDKVGAKAEYEGLLGLELPDRVRTKVEWAIGELAEHPR